jgi:hypothetical protein
MRLCPRDYNEVRPHSSLGNLTPNEFSRRATNIRHAQNTTDTNLRLVSNGVTHRHLVPLEAIRAASRISWERSGNCIIVKKVRELLMRLTVSPETRAAR